MAQRCCVECGGRFEAKSKRAEYCSAKCRKHAFNARAAAKVVHVPAAPQEASEGTRAMVVAELEEAGRLNTYLGAAAIRLAERIDASTAVMGFAALVKELRSTMDAATAGAKKAEDPVDELRRRRDQKRAG